MATSSARAAVQGRRPSRAETRDRILDTAWDLARDRGVQAVSMAEIANASGVSRQLVYLYFTSREGLLVAMARRHDARSGFIDRLLAMCTLPPVEALEHLLRTWCDYVPDILPVARALEAAAGRDEDARAAWQDRMADLHGAIHQILMGLETAGRLAPGWTVEAAADWIWARCQVSGWQHLVVERGWTPAEYVERTVQSIMAEVVADKPTRSGGAARGTGEGPR